MKSRTIKPTFFTNEDLYDAESSSGLPLRVLFAGLWCYADREGRFKWEPRRIKAAILPHDTADCAQALDVLVSARFIGQYVADGVVYGWIPTFHDHQPIHKHEAASKCPPPPALSQLPVTSMELHGITGNVKTERPWVAGNSNNNSSSRSNSDGSSSSEGVQGEKSSVREILSAEPGGAKALEVFCRTVPDAEGYLDSIAMAMDGAYGADFRPTPAEVVGAMLDWHAKPPPEESRAPKVFRGYMRSQRRENERVLRRAQEDAGVETKSSAEIIMAQLAAEGAA